MYVKAKFVVWIRNDGFIAATAGRLPNGWTTGDGSPVTFEKISEHDTWGEAYDRIVLERNNRTAKTGPAS